MVHFLKDYIVSRMKIQLNNIILNCFLVVKDKKIVFRGGVGPFQYSIDKVVEWLKQHTKV